MKDDGSVFSATRGYGWSTRVNTRERHKMSDQAKDTLIHFDSGTTATWQYNLPNGTYLVSLESGDPSYPQGPHHVQVEGITVINNVSTATREFVTITDFPVTVNDGQLSIRLTRGSGSQKTILNYVRITPTDSTTLPAPPPTNEEPPATETPTTETPSSSGQPISVNFQPSSASTPSGYLKDDGSVFSATRGYGWSTRVNTRERHKMSDQAKDTLIHFDSGTTATWQYNLPNGTYLVSLESGDPSYPQGPHHVQVEGITVINNVSTATREFVTITDFPVTVNDGQLSIRLTRGSGSQKTILNYVRITPTDSTTLPAPPPTNEEPPATETPTTEIPTTGNPIKVNFQRSGSTIPSGYQKDDGAIYTQSRGYGWDRSVHTRERYVHSDQRLDTFIHFDQGASCSMEL